MTQELLARKALIERKLAIMDQLEQMDGEQQGPQPDVGKFAQNILKMADTRKTPIESALNMIPFMPSIGTGVSLMRKSDEGAKAIGVLSDPYVDPQIDKLPDKYPKFIEDYAPNFMGPTRGVGEKILGMMSPRNVAKGAYEMGKQPLSWIPGTGTPPAKAAANVAKAPIRFAGKTLTGAAEGRLSKAHKIAYELLQPTGKAAEKAIAKGQVVPAVKESTKIMEKVSTADDLLALITSGKKKLDAARKTMLEKANQVIVDPLKYFKERLVYHPTKNPKGLRMTPKTTAAAEKALADEMAIFPEKLDAVGAESLKEALYRSARKAVVTGDEASVAKNVKAAMARSIRKVLEDIIPDIKPLNKSFGGLIEAETSASKIALQSKTASTKKLGLIGGAVKKLLKVAPAASGSTPHQIYFGSKAFNVGSPERSIKEATGLIKKYGRGAKTTAFREAGEALTSIGAKTPKPQPTVKPPLRLSEPPIVGQSPHAQKFGAAVQGQPKQLPAPPDWSPELRSSVLRKHQLPAIVEPARVPPGVRQAPAYPPITKQGIPPSALSPKTGVVSQGTPMSKGSLEDRLMQLYLWKRGQSKLPPGEIIG